MVEARGPGLLAAEPGPASDMLLLLSNTGPLLPPAAAAAAGCVLLPGSGPPFSGRPPEKRQHPAQQVSK
jgi:hypothetical protein